jgi:hydrogenase-4 component B
MDYLFGALGLFTLGVLTMLLPKRLELGAHYAGMLLAAGASALVLIFGLAILSTGAVMSPLVFGRYSLMVDSWSAAFLLITGLSGTAVSI